MNFVIPYFKSNSPERACNKLVKESVYNWRKEDEIVDDITCICIFLNSSI